MKKLTIPKILEINNVSVLLTAAMFIATLTNIAIAQPQYPLNVKKNVSGVPEGQTKQAVPNEHITYSIEFDSDENDLLVTEITVVDILPLELSFVSAYGDGIIGHYNQITHTYTWEYPFVSPGQVVHLDITVKVNQDVAPGKIITNIVSIDSDQTSPATATADVMVVNGGSETDDGDLLIDTNDLQVTPEIISRQDTSGDVTVVVKLPNGIEKDDVLDEPLTLQPAGIEAAEQLISETVDGTIILAVFNKAALLFAVPFDYFGLYDLEVIGMLKSGRIFRGNTSIYIIGEGDISDYVSSIDINISQIWDYNDPENDTDLMYEFKLEIEAWAGDYLNGFNIDAFVKDIEFITPAGNLFTIPKLDGQWSGGIWRSYEYDPQWNRARWLFRARSSNLNALKAYGDGEYTIQVNDVIDSQSQVALWFGVPGTNDPIAQPTQEPVLIFPEQDQQAGSPITFTWKPCTDKNATEVRINVKDGDTSEYYKEQSVNKERTSWGPVVLTDGSWQAELAYGQWASSSYDDWITIEVGKYSQSRHQFTVTGYPRSTYEVWAGDVFIGLDQGRYLGGGFGSIAQLLANGYVKLGESDGQTATFSGKYRYYLIATRGEIQLDCIQGSNDSYYLSFEPNVEWMNIAEPNNLLGPPDRKYAIIGGNQLVDDFSGYIAFTNPGNWTELTPNTINIITSDIEIEDISIDPDIVRRDGTLTNIMVAIQFPEDIVMEQISDEPLVILPGNIKANNQIVSEIAGRTVVIAVFDSAALMDAIDDFGQVDLQVFGTLTSGHTFSGNVTITITRFAGN
ncbi:MAG: hypothetical protein AMJ75_07955 [Phycisphaerae bacterium SM1_79]|nr:MAG: hypothetical protein AMJ75_07955 [Phycisphaerae bacterium SM1_79]